MDFSSIKIEDSLYYYRESLQLLAELYDNIDKSRIELEPWQEYFKPQLERFIYLSGSMLKLAYGIPIRNFNKKEEELIRYDINSIYIIARAQIEGYLMFIYSQIDIKTKEEGELKYYMYVLSGLNKRQDYQTPMDYQKELKRAEKKTLMNYLTK